jgi:hypothetical protein
VNRKPTPETRRCYKCEEVKSIDLFRKDRAASGGRAYICKQCAHQQKARWRSDNLERARETARRRQRVVGPAENKALREQILREYGGVCVCCGESEPKFLSIDHINNDGAEHRKEVGHGGRLYRWLRRNGFPKDNYQLLCMNCNFAKGRYGLCPHVEKKQAEPDNSGNLLPALLKKRNAR